jgi:LAO/AO transport system kinase
MISNVEQEAPGTRDDLAELYRSGGRMRVVGIAGPPGAGKSTLVAALATEMRAQGKKVGILAVDPSSPLNGGAVLGDRIRMTALSQDEGVFIRSMASRGCVGGLSRAAADAVTVLDGAGMDVTLVETVGVGQGEVEIANLAQSTVIVSVPGLGDEVQALKAGLLEIADIHVVNKADLPGAARTVADLKNTLRLVHPAPGSWVPPVLEATALTGQGSKDLIVALDQHYDWMQQSGELDRRHRTRFISVIRELVQHMVARRLAENGGDLAYAIEDVIARQRDPYSVAIELTQALHCEV